MVSVEIIGHDSRRSMAAVSGAKRVVDINIGIRGQRLCKLFLTEFHHLLGVGVGRVILLNIYGFTFFFRIETEVFEQKHFTGFERSSGIGGFCAVGGELDGASKSSGHSIGNLAQRQFGVHFAFRLTHVRHQNEGATIVQDFFQCGNGTANAGVVGDFTTVVQGHVEVDAHQGFKTGKVEFIDVYHSLFDHLDEYLELFEAGKCQSMRKLNCKISNNSDMKAGNYHKIP